MTALSIESIRGILGPVGITLAAELAATGATERELREAYAWITSDEALVNDMRPLPTGRVAALIEILEQDSGLNDRVT